MGTEVNGPSASLCVVLGAGEIVDYAAVAARIPRDSFVICADGGLAHCAPLGLRPHLLVGDLDSAGNPPADVPVLPLSPHKNYTDTTHAVEEAIGRGYRTLLLCGMLGGRLDHTLANLQTLGQCAVRGISASITDGRTDIYPLCPQLNGGVLKLAPRQGHYFSLLSLVDACSGVTILGGMYPLDDYPLSSLEARAVSNEFLRDTVTVTLDSGVLVVVVTPKG